MKLDEIDLQIVNQLAADGRASGEKIAHRLNIDEGTCRFRMRRLIGDLVDVKAFVNPAMIGFPVSAFLAFKVHPTKVLEAASKLASHRRMLQVNALTGIYDVMGLAVFRSGRDVTTMMQEFAEQIDGVRDIQAIMCLEASLGYYVRISPELLYETGTRTDLDDIDKQMIACLIEDGRLNARDLARMLKIGETPARRRLAQLLDKRVVVVSAVAEASKIGFPVVALVGFKVELPRIREVASALAKHRQINYVTTCAGAFDILAAGMFRSTVDLQKMLQALVHDIDGIKDTQTFVCFDLDLPGRSQWVPRGLLADSWKELEEASSYGVPASTSTARAGSGKSLSGPDWKQILEGKKNREKVLAIAMAKGGIIRVSETADVLHSSGSVRAKARSSTYNMVQGIVRDLVKEKVLERHGRGQYRLTNGHRAGLNSVSGSPTEAKRRQAAGPANRPKAA